MTDFNSQGFRIVSCGDAAPVADVAAQFMYKGYEVSMSTFKSVFLLDVAVYQDDKLAQSCYTVTEAIDWINAQ